MASRKCRTRLRPTHPQAHSKTQLALSHHISTILLYLEQLLSESHDIQETTLSLTAASYSSRLQQQQLGHQGNPNRWRDEHAHSLFTPLPLHTTALLPLAFAFSIVHLTQTSSS